MTGRRPPAAPATPPGPEPMTDDLGDAATGASTGASAGVSMGASPGASGVDPFGSGLGPCRCPARLVVRGRSGAVPADLVRQLQAGKPLGQARLALEVRCTCGQAPAGGEP